MNTYKCVKYLPIYRLLIIEGGLRTFPSLAVLATLHSVTHFIYGFIVNVAIPSNEKLRFSLLKRFQMAVESLQEPSEL